MKKKKIDENSYEIIKSNHTEIRKLEEFYVTNKIEDMLGIIEEKKEALVAEMVNYANTHKETVKWDKDGAPLAYEVKINPLVINNYFFKPLVPITCQEPLYNAEKLGMIFDYYCEILAEVNDKIGNFPSSLTSFCKFAGITLSTLRTYKNSTDLNMRIVVEKIYDQIGDENITMSQMGVIRERSTIFKMKAQNEIIEKEQPKVNINITEVPDLDRINERLNKYRNFAKKKEK